MMVLYRSSKRADLKVHERHACHQFGSEDYKQELLAGWVGGAPLLQDRMKQSPHCHKAATSYPVPTAQ